MWGDTTRLYNMDDKRFWDSENLLKQQRVLTTSKFLRTKMY